MKTRVNLFLFAATAIAVLLAVFNPTEAHALISWFSDPHSAAGFLMANGVLAMEVKDLVPLIEGVKTSALQRFDTIDQKQGEFAARLLQLEQHATREPGGDGELPHRKEALKELRENDSLKLLQEKRLDHTERIPLDLSLKALVNAGGLGDSNDSGYPTPGDRIEGLYGFALRRLTLLDVLPTQETDRNKTEFVQVQWTGEAEVQEHEGAEKAEVEFGMVLAEAPVATIAVHTTVSTQLLLDNEGLESQLETIMTHSVREKIEREVITGSGTGGHMDGLYTQAMPIATTLEPIPERIGEAITQMEIGGYTPNVILMHPSDWLDVSNLKDSEGRYLYGNPAAPAQPALYNRPVITSPSVPEGMAVVGDTSQVTIRDRMNPSVYISTEHKDYRTRNLALILVEARAGLELRDTRAFRKLSLEPQS